MGKYVIAGLIVALALYRIAYSGRAGFGKLHFGGPGFLARRACLDARVENSAPPSDQPDVVHRRNGVAAAVPREHQRGLFAGRCHISRNCFHA